MTDDFDARRALALALREQTRRHFFADCGVGLGAMALASLLGGRAAGPRAGRGRPIAAAVARRRPRHRPPRAAIRSRPVRAISRRGPRASSICSWPAVPASSSSSTTSPSFRSTAASRSPTRSSRAADSPSWISSPRSIPSCWGRSASSRGTASRGRGSRSCLPHLAEVVDDLTFVKSVATDVFNHAPAKLFANTGSVAVRPAEHGLVGHLRHRQRVGRPARLRRAAIGPARAARRGGQLGERLPALDLPGRAAPRRRRADLEPEHARRASRATGSGGPSTAIAALNQARLDVTADPEIATRINAYEIAFRMQIERPGADRPGLGDGRDA